MTGEVSILQEQLSRTTKGILKKSLTDIPQLGRLDELDRTFPFRDLTDLRDTYAFRLGVDVTPITFETTFSRTSVREIRNSDLFIVLYTKKLMVDQQEVLFGRLVINCVRQGILDYFQTILNFKRLEDRYLLDLRSNKLNHEVSISGNITTEMEQAQDDMQLLGILKDISKSLGDNPARNFLVVPLNSVVNSLIARKK